MFTATVAANPSLAMLLNSRFPSTPTVAAGRFPLRSVRFLVFLLAGATVVLAQDPNAGGRRRGNADDNGGGRNFNPQEMQSRLLQAMRDRLEVPDDDEWKIIADRITKVMEIRRTAGGGFGGGMMFGRGGPGGGGDTANTGRGGRGGGSPEAAALAAALRDKLPDAEIKSRLDRMREARKDNEAKLAKAQEDLRAVLSIRQEAMAVVAGLLP